MNMFNIPRKTVAAIHVYDKYHSRTVRVEFSQHDCVISETGNVCNFLIDSPEHGISFRIEARTENKKLEFKIPCDSIREARSFCWLLEGVEIMPEFGARPYGAPGYLLWPNYSGVSCRFDKTVPTEFRDIIYAANSCWENFTSMPVFGITGGDTGFLCIITSGQFECELVHRLAQGPDKLHSTTPLLRFRMDPRQEIEATDRTLEYHFFNGANNNFVEMAKVYRHYLLEQRKILPLKAKQVNNPVLEYASRSQWLKIFCGDKAVQIDGNGKFEAWTTFDQAKELLKALTARGIDKITCMLVGWNQEGHDGRYPDRMPPEERLGGMAQMRKLVEWGKTHGLQMVVHDNYADGFERAESYSPEDIMKDAFGFNQVVGVWSGGESHRLRPAAALRHARNTLPRMKDEIGLEGCFYLDAISLGLEPDFSPDGVKPRGDFARGQLEIVAEAKQIFGACQTENNFDYIFDASDACASVITWPFRTETFNTNICRNMNDFLPFFHIAWHGLVLYHHADLMQFVQKTGESPFKAVLQELSWGALGRIELLYKKSSQKEFASLNDVELLDAAGRQFDLLNRKAGYLQKEFIEDYRQVGEQQFITIFSDGSQVYVDYNNLSCKIIDGNGVIIAEENYSAIPELVS